MVLGVLLKFIFATLLTLQLLIPTSCGVRHTTHRRHFPHASRVSASNSRINSDSFSRRHFPSASRVAAPASGLRSSASASRILPNATSNDLILPFDSNLLAQDMSEQENGLKSVDSPDTLDSLLDFLKQSNSPVSGVMELRGLLLAQKEEKIELRSLVDQMRVDMQAIRYLLKLQTEEIQIHAEEMSNLRNELDEEKAQRKKMEHRLRVGGALNGSLPKTQTETGAKLKYSQDEQTIDIQDKISVLSDQQENSAAQLEELNQKLGEVIAKQNKAEKNFQDLRDDLLTLDENMTQVMTSSKGRTSEVSQMKSSIEDLKTNLDTLLTHYHISQNNQKGKTPAYNDDQNSQPIVINQKLQSNQDSRYLGDFMNLEKLMIERHQRFANETQQRLMLEIDAVNRDLTKLTREFAAKSDNGTDVMKEVFSLIHSLTEGLKRTNGKQRKNEGLIDQLKSQFDDILSKVRNFEQNMSEKVKNPQKKTDTPIYSASTFIKSHVPVSNISVGNPELMKNFNVKVAELRNEVVRVENDFKAEKIFLQTVNRILKQEVSSLTNLVQKLATNVIDVKKRFGEKNSKTNFIAEHDADDCCHVTVDRVRQETDEKILQLRKNLSDFATKLGKKPPKEFVLAEVENQPRNLDFEDRIIRIEDVLMKINKENQQHSDKNNGTPLNLDEVKRMKMDFDSLLIQAKSLVSSNEEKLEKFSLEKQNLNKRLDEIDTKLNKLEDFTVKVHLSGHNISSKEHIDHSGNSSYNSNIFHDLVHQLSNVAMIVESMNKEIKTLKQDNQNRFLPEKESKINKEFSKLVFDVNSKIENLKQTISSIKEQPKSEIPNFKGFAHEELDTEVKEIHQNVTNLASKINLLETNLISFNKVNHKTEDMHKNYHDFVEKNHVTQKLVHDVALLSETVANLDSNLQSLKNTLISKDSKSFPINHEKNSSQGNEIISDIVSQRLESIEKDITEMKSSSFERKANLQPASSTSNTVQNINGVDFKEEYKKEFNDLVSKVDLKIDHFRKALDNTSKNKMSPSNFIPSLGELNQSLVTLQSKVDQLAEQVTEQNNNQRPRNNLATRVHVTPTIVHDLALLSQSVAKLENNINYINESLFKTKEILNVSHPLGLYNQPTVNIPDVFVLLRRMDDIENKVLGLQPNLNEKRKDSKVTNTENVNNGRTSIDLMMQYRKEFELIVSNVNSKIEEVRKLVEDLSSKRLESYNDHETMKMLDGSGFEKKLGNLLFNFSNLSSKIAKVEEIIKSVEQKQNLNENAMRNNNEGLMTTNVIPTIIHDVALLSKDVAKLYNNFQSLVTKNENGKLFINSPTINSNYNIQGNKTNDDSMMSKIGLIENEMLWLKGEMLGKISNLDLSNKTERMTIINDILKQTTINQKELTHDMSLLANMVYQLKKNFSDFDNTKRSKDLVNNKELEKNQNYNFERCQSKLERAETKINILEKDIVDIKVLVKSNEIKDIERLGGEVLRIKSNVHKLEEEIKNGVKLWSPMKNVLFNLENLRNYIGILKFDFDQLKNNCSDRNLVLLSNSTHQQLSEIKNQIKNINYKQNITVVQLALQNKILSDVYKDFYGFKQLMWKTAKDQNYNFSYEDDLLKYLKNKVQDALGNLNLLNERVQDLSKDHQSIKNSVGDMHFKALKHYEDDVHLTDWNSGFKEELLNKINKMQESINSTKTEIILTVKDIALLTQTFKKLDVDHHKFKNVIQEIESKGDNSRQQNLKDLSSMKLGFEPIRSELQMSVTTIDLLTNLVKKLESDYKEIQLKLSELQQKLKIDEDKNKGMNQNKTFFDNDVVTSLARLENLIFSTKSELSIAVHDISNLALNVQKLSTDHYTPHEEKNKSENNSDFKAEVFNKISYLFQLLNLTKSEFQTSVHELALMSQVVQKLNKSHEKIQCLIDVCKESSSTLKKGTNVLNNYVLNTSTQSSLIEDSITTLKVPDYELSVLKEQMKNLRTDHDLLKFSVDEIALKNNNSSEASFSSKPKDSPDIMPRSEILENLGLIHGTLNNTKYELKMAVADISLLSQAVLQKLNPLKNNLQDPQSDNFLGNINSTKTELGEVVHDVSLLCQVVKKLGDDTREIKNNLVDISLENFKLKEALSNFKVPSNNPSNNLHSNISSLENSIKTTKTELGQAIHDIVILTQAVQKMSTKEHQFDNNKVFNNNDEIYKEDFRQMNQRIDMCFEAQNKTAAEVFMMSNSLQKIISHPRLSKEEPITLPMEHKITKSHGNNEMNMLDRRLLALENSITSISNMCDHINQNCCSKIGNISEKLQILEKDVAVQHQENKLITKDISLLSDNVAKKFHNNFAHTGKNVNEDHVSDSEIINKKIDKLTKLINDIQTTTPKFEDVKELINRKVSQLKQINQVSRESSSQEDSREKNSHVKPNQRITMNHILDLNSKQDSLKLTIDKLQETIAHLKDMNFLPKQQTFKDKSFIDLNSRLLSHEMIISHNSQELEKMNSMLNGMSHDLYRFLPLKNKTQPEQMVDQSTVHGFRTMNVPVNNQEELETIKMEMENLKKVKAHDKKNFEHLFNLSDRLIKDVEILHKNKPEDSNFESFGLVLSNLKDQFENFKMSLQKIADKVDNYEHVPVLQNMTSYLTTLKQDLNNLAAAQQSQRGNNLHSNGATGAAVDLSRLHANLEALQNDVSQLKSSNTSVALDGLSRKYDEMFSQTVLSLNKTLEFQRDIEARFRRLETDFGKNLQNYEDKTMVQLYNEIKDIYQKFKESNKTNLGNQISFLEGAFKVLAENLTVLQQSTRRKFDDIATIVQETKYSTNDLKKLTNKEAFRLSTKTLDRVIEIERNLQRLNEMVNRLEFLNRGALPASMNLMKAQMTSDAMVERGLRNHIEDLTLSVSALREKIEAMERRDSSALNRLEQVKPDLKTLQEVIESLKSDISATEHGLKSPNFLSNAVRHLAEVTKNAKDSITQENPQFSTSQNPLKLDKLSSQTLTEGDRTTEMQAKEIRPRIALEPDMRTELNSFRAKQEQLRSDFIQFREFANDKFSKVHSTEMQMFDHQSSIDRNLSSLKFTEAQNSKLIQNLSQQIEHGATMNSKVSLKSFQEKLQVLESMFESLHASVQNLTRNQNTIGQMSQDASFAVKQLDGQILKQRDREEEMGHLQQKLSQLGEKLEKQQVLFSEARHQFLNASLAKVERENNELRQSVRIADNELRIMLHEEELTRLKSILKAEGKMAAEQHKLNSPSVLKDVQLTLPIIHKRIEKLDRVMLELERPLPKDCTEINQLKTKHQLIQPHSAMQGPVRVECDGGRTVIQKRLDGKVSFERNWTDYQQGFGDVRGDHWLGLDILYLMTLENDYTMVVDVWDSAGQFRSGQFSGFKIGSATEKYKLSVGPLMPGGNLTDAFSYHNGQPFSTLDVDNDGSPENCAKMSKGGWWYRHCYNVNLNGDFLTGMSWLDNSQKSWIHIVKSKISLVRNSNFKSIMQALK